MVLTNLNQSYALNLHSAKLILRHQPFVDMANIIQMVLQEEENVIHVTKVLLTKTKQEHVSMDNTQKTVSLVNIVQVRHLLVSIVLLEHSVLATVLMILLSVQSVMMVRTVLNLVVLQSLVYAKLDMFVLQVTVLLVPFLNDLKIVITKNS